MLQNIENLPGFTLQNMENLLGFTLQNMENLLGFTLQNMENLLVFTLQNMENLRLLGYSAGRGGTKVGKYKDGIKRSINSYAVQIK